MSSQLPAAIHQEQLKVRLFWVFGCCTALAVWAAIGWEEILLAGIPFGLLLAYQTLVNYKTIYVLLFATIPLSTEVFFSDSLATDLPSEPLMVGLMLVYILQVLARPDLIDGRFWRHPLTILLLFHLGWTAYTTILSDNVAVSFKFLLAKFWYIVTFFLLTGHILRREQQVWQLLWWVVLPLALASAKVLIHHAYLDFGFREVNSATSPFFRNHVSYAAVNALMLPLLACFWWKQKVGTWAWHLLTACLVIVSCAVLTAYTRAAYLALLLAVAALLVIRFRLIQWTLLAGVVAIVGIFSYLITNNNFMELAPSERTIAHEEFGDIIAATYTLEDVSTSERYYRWIAGLRMSAEAPLTGFGPGNFYSYYKGYTLNRFTTYVSDNPERSGIHNYFLMLLVEQGWIGMLLFIGIVFYTFWVAQRVYHKAQSSSQRLLVAGLLMLLTVIDAFLLMNDMIETDKVGSFFFFSMAILVNLDLRQQKEERAIATKSPPI